MIQQLVVTRSRRRIGTRRVLFCSHSNASLQAEINPTYSLLIYCWYSLLSSVPPLPPPPNIFHQGALLLPSLVDQKKRWAVLDVTVFLSILCTYFIPRVIKMITVIMVMMLMAVIQRQKQYLEQILKSIPASKHWNQF